MDLIEHVPRGVLAQLTHVRGTGMYTGGIERPDVHLVFATSIPEDVCRRIKVGYLDPRSIRLTDYMNKDDEGILFADHAGEILHRLESPLPKE